MSPITKIPGYEGGGDPSCSDEAEASRDHLAEQAVQRLTIRITSRAVAYAFLMRLSLHQRGVNVNPHRAHPSQAIKFSSTFKKKLLTFVLDESKLTL